MITRSDLAAVLQHEHQLSKTKSQEILKSIFRTMLLAIRQGEPISILGFGKIQRRWRRLTQKERERRGKVGRPLAKRTIYVFTPPKGNRNRPIRGGKQQ